jgi:hypothetical protein
MLKFEFKDASPERKQEMLLEIISKYNVSNKNELVQALGHAQAVLDCTQEDFASNSLVSISTRQLRTHKKEYLDLYEIAVAKYQQTPELKNVDNELEEDALEAVYTNLLARLQSPKTSTKDLATILEYFGISGNELRQYASLRNSTMRGFFSDNMQSLVPNETNSLLVKAVIAESPFLYQGTEKTAGNSFNAQSIDLDNPIVRLEAQTLGLLFISLFNGIMTDAFVNHAETLRLLKLASGADKKQMKVAHRDFDKMDGKVPALKALSPTMEKDLIEWFGEAEGKKVFAQLTKVKDKVTNKTAIQMPKYEDVADDYAVHLKAYGEAESKSLRILLAQLDAQLAGKNESLKEKYKEFLEVNED